MIDSQDDDGVLIVIDLVDHAIHPSSRRVELSEFALQAPADAMGVFDELYVIAAAVIGGTSLSGGVGTIYGAIIGALVLVSLQTGMVLIGFGDGSYQRMVTGVALVLAVYLDIVYRKRIK